MTQLNDITLDMNDTSHVTPRYGTRSAQEMQCLPLGTSSWETAVHLQNRQQKQLGFWQTWILSLFSRSLCFPAAEMLHLQVKGETANAQSACFIVCLIDQDPKHCKREQNFYYPLEKVQIFQLLTMIFHIACVLLSTALYIQWHIILVHEKEERKYLEKPKVKPSCAFLWWGQERHQSFTKGAGAMTLCQIVWDIKSRCQEMQKLPPAMCARIQFPFYLYLCVFRGSLFCVCEQWGLGGHCVFWETAVWKQSSECRVKMMWLCVWMSVCQCRGESGRREKGSALIYTRFMTHRAPSHCSLYASKSLQSTMGVGMVLWSQFREKNEVFVCWTIVHTVYILNTFNFFFSL